MLKRIMSLLLVLGLLLSFVPTTFAQEEENTSILAEEVTQEASASPVEILEESESFDLASVSSDDLAIPATTGSHVTWYAAPPIVADGTCGSSLTWVLNGDGTLMISGTGTMRKYSSSSNNLAPWYSYRTQIHTVVIENGVTAIGDYAFYDCRLLEAVTIPNSVTSIGGSAFLYCCALKELVIPYGASFSGSFCLSGCSSLRTFTIPDGVTSLGPSAFRNCRSLESVQIPDSVTSIGYNAFEGCKSLKAISLPNNVTKIYFNAFDHCIALTEITIPAGVDTISREAFYCCTALERVYIPDSVTKIESGAFEGCSSLIEIAIPDNVTNIAPEAFYGCSSLTEFKIPGNVTQIADSVLSKCSSLKSIDIPASVTSIEYRAFDGCTSLVSVSIPESVTKIASTAFSDCSGLTGIWVSENNQYFCNDAHGVLFNKEKTSLIACPGGIEGVYQIPDSVVSLEQESFCGCSSLEGVVIPNGITTIERFTFYKCSSLKTVVIPDSVTSILPNAFRECYSLVEITIPNRLTSIDSFVFEDCSSLAQIIIPDSVAQVSGSAFAGCNSLDGIWVSENNKYLSNDADGVLFNKDKTKLIACPRNLSGTYKIPDSVTSIAEHAFDGCSMLTSVILPADMTSIDSDAFYGCTGFTTLTIPDRVSSIGSCAFSHCSSLTSVVIPESVTSIGTSAFGACTALTQVTLPSNGTLKTLTGFSGCRALTSLTIPESVTAIGAFAFSDCYSLSSITIPSSVTTIEACAFLNCPSLREVIFTGKAPVFKPLSGYAWSGIRPEYAKLSYSNCFFDDTLTAYFHPDASGWDNAAWEDYGGYVTWVPHAMDTVVTEPICTEPGYTTHICAECGANYVDNYVYTPKHTESDDVQVYPCFRDFTCANCGEAVRVWNDPRLEGLSMPTSCASVTMADDSAEMPWTRNGSRLQSSNQGRNSSTSATRLIFTLDFGGTLAFDYGVSSESRYDTLTIMLNGTTIANSISGKRTGSYSRNLGPGTYTLYLQYSKDILNSQYDDLGYIDNLVLTAYEVAPHKHSYAAVVTTFPTCNESGFTTYTCKCGESYSEYTPAALGHAWNKGQVTVQPTILAEGQMTFTCTRCKETRTETIPKLDPWALQITKQPEIYVGPIGSTASFHVEASGESLTYQWYYSPDNVGWSASGLTGSKTDTLQVAFTANRAGQFYRCEVRSAKGEVLTSDAVFMCEKLPPITIQQQPESFMGKAGEFGVFQVKASGEGLTYQWYYSKDNGVTWSKSSMDGSTTDTMLIQLTMARAGQCYRCEITDADGNILNSEQAAIKLETENVEIKYQPVSANGYIGETTSFHVEATGIGLTYQWYYSKNGGQTWAPSGMAGSNTDTLKVQLTAARVGQVYCCKIVDYKGDIVCSDEVAMNQKISVVGVLEINAQPTDFTGKVGDTAVFYVDAVGEALTFQWQYSKDGKQWDPSGLPGSKTDTLRVDVTAARFGQHYRCVITDVKGKQIISDPVTLHQA